MTFIDASALAGSAGPNSPRAFLAINGQNIPLESATVTRKSERSADTFSAVLLVDTSAQYGMGLAEWADYQPVDVQILMALTADGGPQSMITGQIDDPKLNWAEMSISISGRDKSGPLTENRRSQKFQNQKSSDIVSTIAGSYGLTPSIQDSGDFAGKIYDQDTVHLLLNRSDHEVLSDLAEREGYRWYVDGTTLYFEPRGQDTDVFTVKWYPPGTAAPYGVATCTDLATHRNMTASKPHNLNVKSWNHRDKKLYTGTASASGTGAALDIEHHHNGKTQAQSDKLAASRVADAVRHGCNVVIKMPADLGVTPRQKLQLTGTGTIYDQLYDIDSVEFDLSWMGGLDMTIEAKIAKSGTTGTSNTGSTSDGPVTPPSVGAGGIGHA